MAISENDLKTIREMFMEAGADLLKQERAIVEGRINERFDKFEKRLDEIAEDISRLDHSFSELNVEVAKINLAFRVEAAKRSSKKTREG